MPKQEISILVTLWFIWSCWYFYTVHDRKESHHVGLCFLGLLTGAGYILYCVIKVLVWVFQLFR